jgi:hypothetical protein
MRNAEIAARTPLPMFTDMSTVQEIETAIQQLPERDVLSLTQWLDDYAERQWDKRIEADVASGALAALADEARTARANGTRRRFP